MTGFRDTTRSLTGLKRRATSNPLGVARFDSGRGLEAMTKRKNLKIATDTYDDLRDEKRDMETWDSMFRRLLRDGGE